MQIDAKQNGALRPAPCTYGVSKVNFRGPRRPTTGRFIAFLGGSETYAKYVDQPFVDLIENAIGEVCVNLGCQSAGPDVFLQDKAVRTLCHDAAAVVIQIVGAVNQSNAYYKVHPRRNDRFIAPTVKLKTLYPEIDFTEIAFTGHLIARLRAVDEARFADVRTHLQRTWIRRMTSLIGQSTGPVLLLWLCAGAAEVGLQNPALVTNAMIDELRPDVLSVIPLAAQSKGADRVYSVPSQTRVHANVMAVTTHLAAAQVLQAPLLRCLN